MYREWKASNEPNEVVGKHVAKILASFCGGLTITEDDDPQR